MFEGLDCTRVSPADAVDLLRDVDREIARLHAIQADLIVTAASPEPEELVVWVRDDVTDGERRLLIDDPIRDELAAALHRSSLVMQRMIHGGWDITQSRPDGTCVWRSPHGRLYEHDPTRLDE